LTDLHTHILFDVDNYTFIIGTVLTRVSRKNSRYMNYYYAYKQD